MSGGRFYLVGAGPGDASLLTVRAVEVLATADLILAGPGECGAPLGARGEHAWHRVGEEGGLSTEAAMALAVERFRAGETVVRLLPGDPFVHGVGLATAQALAREAIPFEVVPGLAPLFAGPAAAGIPLAATVGLRATVAPVGTAVADLPRRTTVVLDNLESVPAEVEALLTDGWSPDTPAAAISQAYTARQRTVVGTLERLVPLLREAALRAPTVVVIGAGVRWRETLGWFEARPLFGRRIVVTRAPHQSSAMLERLRAMGADPVPLPTIELCAPDSWEPLDRAIAELDRYDQLVFTSANGVDFFWERLRHAGCDARHLAGLRLATIGPATAAALAQRGVGADLQAREFKAEGLVAEMVRAGVRGTRVLVVRAAKARQVLIDSLREAGAEVVVVAAYQTVLPTETTGAARSALAGGEIDAITFTSASTVDNFCRLVGETEAPQLLEDVVVGCIGPITRDAAAAHGIACEVMPDAYTIPALCEALAAHFAAAPAG